MIRPEQHLINAKRDYPELTQMIDMFRESRGKDLPKWASYCFLPMAAWYSIVSNTKNQGRPLLDIALMQELQLLAACGTWRYSKGVYKFDDELYRAVISSEVSGNLPSQVLMRLPEWCIYVETQEMNVFDNACYGFWTWLEQDQNHGHTELRILLDLEDGFTSVPLHLGDWDLKAAVQKYLDEAGYQAAKLGKDWSQSEDDISGISHDIMPIVSLILFICSESPDITNLESPENQPSRPQAKKTKKGWRLFPADKVKNWSVGSRYGEMFRRDIHEYQSTSGRTVKPHLRRGHYHTYWTGKRGSDEQKAVLKFVMPMIVRASD